MNRLGLFCFLLFSSLSFAETIQRSDLGAMSKKSDIIIHGYVGDQSVSEDKMGRIITLTQIEVIDALKKSKTGQIITVYQVGGTKDGVVSPIMGGQKFNFGEQVILFGLTVGDGKYVPYGKGQGKFDVKSEKFITEDLGDVSDISMQINGSLRTIHASPRTFDDLKLFKEEIKAILKS